jgi:outer membrane protein TolC
MATSPAIAAAAQRVRQAQFTVAGARSQPNPEINVGHGFGTSATGLDEDILLTQTVELGSKIGLRRQQASGELAAAEAEATQARTTLTYQVKSAYYQMVEADAVVALNRELVQIAARFQQSAQAQFDAGDVPRAQLVRSQIELATSRQSQLLAETDQYTRRAALNVLIGAPPDAPVALAEPPPFRAQRYEAARLQQLAAERPDMRSAEATLAARRSAARLAAVAGQPDLAIQGAHAHLDEWPGNSLRIGLVFPIFDYGRLRAQRNTAEAAVAEQEANVEALRRQVRLEVDTALHRLEQAGVLAESLTGEVLTQSRQLQTMAQIGYQAGENTYLELLDAQRVYQTAATDALRAVTAYRLAEAALEQALGAPLPPGSGGSPAAPAAAPPNPTSTKGNRP